MLLQLILLYMLLLMLRRPLRVLLGLLLLLLLLLLLPPPMLPLSALLAVPLVVFAAWLRQKRHKRGPFCAGHLQQLLQLLEQQALLAAVC